MAIQPRNNALISGYRPAIRVKFGASDSSETSPSDRIHGVSVRPVEGDSAPSADFMAALRETCEDMPDVMEMLRRCSYSIMGVQKLHDSRPAVTSPGVIRMAETYEYDAPREIFSVIQGLQKYGLTLKSLMAHEAGHAFELAWYSLSGGRPISESSYFVKSLRADFDDNPAFARWVQENADGHYKKFKELFADIASECMGYPALSAAMSGDSSFRYEKAFPHSYRFVKGLLYAFNVPTPGLSKTGSALNVSG